MKDLPPYCLREPLTSDPLPEFVMRLDSSLPKMHRVPVHPETGKPWIERARELQVLETRLRYENEPDPADVAELKALNEKTQFREEPLFMEEHLLLGSALAGAVIPRLFRCHPETWAGVLEQQKAKFKLEMEADWRIPV